MHACQHSTAGTSTPGWRHNTAHVPLSRNGMSQGCNVQQGLQLTAPQLAKVLAARRCLLDKLRGVGLERRRLLSALGLHLLHTPQDQWAHSPPVQRLQNNLGQERAAASAFLFSTIDEVHHFFFAWLSLLLAHEL